MTETVSSEIDLSEFKGIYVQSHMEGLSPEVIKRRLDEAEELGASVKFDLRWNLLFPEKEINSTNPILDLINEKQYKTALELVGQRPNQKPILILDSPPNWANDSIKNGDTSEIFDSYMHYAEHVAHMIKESGVKPSYIQVMNEINNPIYNLSNKITLEMFGQFCRITKKAFAKEFGQSPPIMLAFLADPKFLNTLAIIKDDFDYAGFDYYQGTYPTKYAPLGLFSKNPTQVYGDRRLMKDMFDEFIEGGALFGKKVVFAEVGAPTPRGKIDENRQRIFYNQFFRSLNFVLNEYHQKNIKIPLIGIGLYGLEDQPQRPGSEFHSLFYPIQKIFNEYFERRFGIYDEHGIPKGVIDNPSKSRDVTLPDRIKTLSTKRLSKIYKLNITK
jgi:hypothetical protein